jgi:hypothetical protein
MPYRFLIMFVWPLAALNQAIALGCGHLYQASQVIQDIPKPLLPVLVCARVDELTAKKMVLHVIWL